MKNPPTLADACAATALDKRFSTVSYGTSRAVWKLAMNNVVAARKIVLDSNTSAYLAELSASFWRGGIRKRNRMLENARQLARLPHAQTWIEIDFATGYMPKALEIGILRVKSLDAEPAKYGWLLRQHPKLDTAFICTEYRSATHEKFENLAFVHPVSVTWNATDEPLMWPRFSIDHDPSTDVIVGIADYRSSQVRLTPSFEDEIASVSLLQAMAPPLEKRVPGWQTYMMPRLAIRDIWALLATINDLPVTIEHVIPSKGYVARGSYKKFLAHTVVHLTVPEMKWRKLIGKTAAALRRRAHQVRGHWRKDWRHPLATACPHEFGGDMVCRHCGGHKLWIPEHQRGDASLGFVTHDYAVHHD